MSASPDFLSSRPPPSSWRPSWPERLAWLVLVWEQLWPVLCLPLAGVALFLAVALLDVLPGWPDWLHHLVLLSGSGGLAYILAHGLWHWRWPEAAEVRRRLERDNALPHRPLGTLADHLADDSSSVSAPGAQQDSVTHALWRAHCARAAAGLGRLRPRGPHPNMAARDPLALRMLAVLLLWVSAMGAWGEWTPRLRAALSPGALYGHSRMAAVLDIWITPPAYTGEPPLLPNQIAAGTVLAIPAGSVVSVRVSGGREIPQLQVNDQETALRAENDADDAPAGWQGTQEIRGGNRLSVRQGRQRLGDWPARVIPDNPPQVALVAPPVSSARATLRLEYHASDDYGLTGLSARLHLDPTTLRGIAFLPKTDPESAVSNAPTVTATQSSDSETLEIPLPLPGSQPKDVRHSSAHDLTAHPWAGLPVILHLTARDAVGHHTLSENAALRLPERRFQHPVARALVQERQRLAWLGPAIRAEAIATLTAIAGQPDTFRGDSVVLLALRATIGRLTYDHSPTAWQAAQSLLWDTALRLEDGSAALAGRDVQNAAAALAEALDRDAPDSEIETLFGSLQEALDRYMNALADDLRQAQARGEAVPELPPELADRVLDRDDLLRSLDSLRDLTRTGARAAARNQLAELRNMLEQLQAGAQSQPDNRSGSHAAAWELMRELKSLMRQQQDALDRNFRRTQEQRPDVEEPSPPPVNSTRPPSRSGWRPPLALPEAEHPAQLIPREDVTQQDGLRRQLGEVMRRVGEQLGTIPPPLGLAERAMRDASRALADHDPHGAIPPQTQALDGMRQGLEQFTRQTLDRALGLAPDTSVSRGAGRHGGPNRDPLGRPLPGDGLMDGSDVFLPAQVDPHRAQDILQELRRRAGQPHRPRPERDYIERLLRRF